MKYGLLFFLLSAIGISCEQGISDGQADSFMKYYGSTLEDQTGDVEVLSDGGFAICGTASSATQGKRMVLVVTDKFGNVKNGFPKYFQEDGLQTGGTSLIAIEGGSGGFILSGYVEKALEGSTGVQKDIFVVRTTAAGELTWQRSYGSSDDEQVLHSVERIHSGYLLGGSRMKNGNSDLMIMGVTESGDSIRLGLNYSNPYARNSNVNYLLNAGNRYLCVCTFDKANGEGTGIQVLSFDDELSPLARDLSGVNDEAGACILDEGGGRYLVLGNRKATGGMELVLYTVETSGPLIINPSLHATISEPGMDLVGERIIRTSSGDLAVTGGRLAGTNLQILLQFISSSYQEGQQVVFGASGMQSGKDIELADDGGLVILGTNAYGGSSMITLLKTSGSGELGNK